MKTRVIQSNGNVFADLGVAAPEELAVKAKLAARLADLIARKDLTQAEAAQLLGVDQPKISALLRGKLTGFSTERLMRFLTALGSNVRIVVEDRPQARGRGSVQVVSP